MLFALLSLSSVVAAQTSSPAQPTATTAPSKKLIEFGWDQPETAYLRAHAEEMQKRPFDGTVFTVRFIGADGAVGNFSNEVWGKRKFTDAELQPALDDLRATKLTTFTDNFLRFNVMPGDIDWFDDFFGGDAQRPASSSAGSRGARRGDSI